MKGKFLLVLHAHLPYIRHPDFDDFMEEHWLFEAINETYIPLLKVFDSLDKKNINFKVTMSITPPLMEMLVSKNLNKKFLKYMYNLIDLSKKEIEKTKTEDPRKHKMAKYYNKLFQENLRVYSDKFNHNILQGFKEFQEKGYIEVVTCNGTHGFLPSMIEYPASVRAQIKTGINIFKEHFNETPKGMWLAECGYFKGLDKYLLEENIKYFFVDSHAFWYSEVPARYNVYRPVITPNNVFVFARDPESSEQIWSADVGYPGDSRYRDFYRDVGFDREYSYIKPYIDKSGIRSNTGIKYYKITDKNLNSNEKDYYDIDESMQAVVQHVKDFVNKKTIQIKSMQNFEEEPIIVAPFDAELFGHWWYEGPMFLEKLFEELAKSELLSTATPTEIIKTSKKVQILEPAPSTWGANGYNQVWINETNDWIYPYLNEMIEKMVKYAKSKKEVSKIVERTLNQMARELLLAQSSDWAFIMSTNTTVEYAKNRVQTHVKRFFELEEMIKNENINEEVLSRYEWLDKLFKNMDFRIYGNNEFAI